MAFVKMQEKKNKSISLTLLCLHTPDMVSLSWGPQQHKLQGHLGEKEEKKNFQVSREAYDLDSNYSLAQISSIISY